MSQAADIALELERAYPEADTELLWDSPLELLVATILSAQSTDVRVNLITRDLFERYKTAADYAGAVPAELEEEIRSSGFYRNKAKSLIGMGKALVEYHQGKVPKDIESLVALPGVARKTANVVLGTAYGIPAGFVVDTHVKRLAQRLGLSTEKSPDKVERDLMDCFPKEQWIATAHRLILHGRRVCHARKPDCSACELAGLCPRIGVGE